MSSFIARCEVAAFAVLTALLANALEVAVRSFPALPATNILDGTNANGKVGPLFVKKGDKNPWRSYSPKALTLGVKYVASCRIKPSKEVSTKATPGAGLGFSLTFWDKTWKKAVSFGIRGEGDGEWKTIVGEPVTMTDWAVHGQMSAGLSYSGGEGWVDDLRLVPATAKLQFGARGKSLIRQVKVVDEADAAVFDSDVMTPGVAVFKQEIEVNAAHRYTVLAVDDEGDVAVKVYPDFEKMKER